MKYKLNSNKHPVLPVTINGETFMPLRAIIDTGARDNFIFLSREYSKRFDKNERTGNTILAYTPTGEKIECEEIKTTIEICGLKFDITCGLTNGYSSDADMILGTRFLFDNQMTLLVSRGNLLLKKASKLDDLYFSFHP